VFDEPWQAEAFALAVQLSGRGYFTWSEWTLELGAQLRASGISVPATPSRYYECWLTALEQLVVTKRLSDPETLAARKAAYALARRETTHGVSQDSVRGEEL